MPRRCGDRSFVLQVRLEPTQQSQDDDHDENEAYNPRRPVSPTSAVAPSWKDAEQDENEDNDKDCA